MLFGIIKVMKFNYYDPCSIILLHERWLLLFVYIFALFTRRQFIGFRMK
jgi:hypothetical protein